MCHFLDWRWGQLVLKPSQSWGTINLKKGKWMPKTANIFYWWINHRELLQSHWWYKIGRRRRNFITITITFTKHLFWRNSLPIHCNRQCYSNSWLAKIFFHSNFSLVNSPSTIKIHSVILYFLNSFECLSAQYEWENLIPYNPGLYFFHFLLQDIYIYTYILPF